MKLVRDAHVTFEGEGLFGDRATFEIRYDNAGEPYREGARFSIEHGKNMTGPSVMLDTAELIRLHDCISKMLGYVK